MISDHAPGNPFAKAVLLILQTSLFVMLTATDNRILAQDDEVAIKANELRPVAVVGDNSIWHRQIEWEFKKKFSGKVMDDAVAQRLRYKIFVRLVKQHVILDKFRGTDIYANDDEVELQINQLKERLRQIDKKLNDYLDENETKLDDLKFNLRWQLSWKRYLNKTLTDKVLEKYYGRNSFRFDGTRLKVSHLLLKIPPVSNAETTIDRDKLAKKAREKIAAIKARIENGEVTWQAAVAQHSQGSTAQQAGAIGEIGIDGPMPVPFTEAAFQLQVGEISSIVETSFGVHLIRCEEVIVGHRNWYDCKKELRQAATEELFDRIAKKHKSQVTVRVLADAPKK